MYKKILYIGANLHLDPLTHFPDCKEFIFIDGLPRNEYGYEYYYRGFYKKNFYEELNREFEKLGFVKTNEEVFTNDYSEILVKHLNSTCLTFIKNNCNVKYYISTGIPNNLHKSEYKKLQEDLSTIDTILISGYFPSNHILDYISKNNPIHIIGYSNTGYPKTLEELYDKQTIIYDIINPSIKIKSYLSVNYDTGEKTVCKDYYELCKSF